MSIAPTPKRPPRPAGWEQSHTYIASCDCLKCNQERKNRMSDVAVGDLDSDEKGTGARKNGGKVSFSLIPLHLLAGAARVLMGGIVKYKSWNWAKGMPWSVCFDCTMRHLLKWWYMREEVDKKSGEHHLDHAICNLLFLRHYDLAYKEGDDRPPENIDFKEALEFFNTFFDAEAYCKREDT